MNRYKSVAAHNCANYAVDLTLYMLPGDWDKIDREYELQVAGVAYHNEKGSCSMVGPYKTCKFYLSPENPRMGLMMGEGAYGLLTYVAQWGYPRD